MQNLRMLGAALAAGALLGPARGLAAGEDAALIANGGFEQSANATVPDGWGKMAAGASWEVEEGNHFLRLKTQEAGKTVMLYRALPLKPEVKALDLSYRVRFTDIKPGKESWYDGRIMMDFVDAAGKPVKPSTKAPNFRGSSTGWVERKQQIPVPEGAVTLKFMPSLFQAESGTLDFDDIKLTPAAPAAPAP